MVTKIAQKAEVSIPVDKWVFYQFESHDAFLAAKASDYPQDSVCQRHSDPSCNCFDCDSRREREKEEAEDYYLECERERSIKEEAKRQLLIQREIERMKKWGF